MPFLWIRRRRTEEGEQHDEPWDVVPGPEFTWEIESDDMPARYRMEQRREPLVQLRPDDRVHDYVVRRSGAGERPVASGAFGLGPVQQQGKQRSVRSSSPYAGAQGAQRVAYIRYWLNAAIERWRRYQELPPLPLLRDGLLLLEAGIDLEESERLLLLRAALRFRRGVITALRHQQDPERTAALVMEGMLDSHAPLTSDEVTVMHQTDPDGHVWFALLIRHLIDMALLTSEPRRTQAQRILDDMRGIPLKRWPAGDFTAPSEPQHAPYVFFWTRVVLLVLVFVATWYVWGRVSANRVEAEISVPGGQYTISESGLEDRTRQVVTKPYGVDRAEVTNREYRRCYEHRSCGWPSAIDSATRSNYFLDSVYDDYPVVQVTWTQADRFCRWQGGRLPSEAEWEIAAGAAYGTLRQFEYPWGDHFAIGLANAAPGQFNDTTAVGLYHPAGTSPFGLWDAAGNVAEWTATAATTTERSVVNQNAFVVKGGSFRDEPEHLQVRARKIVEADTFADWIGFRCIYPVGER